MKRIRHLPKTVIALGLTIAASTPARGDNINLIGPEWNEYPFEVTDFSACTNELVDWKLVISEFLYIHVSGSPTNPRFHGIVHFSWTGTAAGQSTGYLWETSGGGKESLNFDATDLIPFRDVFLENAILMPVSDGAPKMKFEAQVRLKNDENGMVVPEVLSFEFRCLGN